jgi:HlyD family secretion protein
MTLKRLPVRVALIAAVVAVLAFVTWRLLRGDGATEGIVASGTVEATDADLGFEIAGRVAEIAVREGDPVRSGERLAVLDQTELQAAVRAARSQAAAAEARLDELTRGFRTEEVAQARANLRAAESRMAKADEDLSRGETLYQGGAISKEAYDQLTTARDVMLAEAEAARERLLLMERGPRPEQIAAQRASVEAAEAEVGRIEARLTFAEVRAPFDGVVTVRHREPGETVSPGLPVLTIMNPSDRWVRIYVPGDRVGDLHLGDAATIQADADRRRVYEGEIMHIASEAEFTPRNVQTTEERVKLVYEVRVRITGDPEMDLKPGLPADVTVLEGRS